MRSIQIDLAQPFEEVVATVLSLPTGCSNQDGHRLVSDVEFKQVIRGLYEAANGRQVETKWGRVALAPPTAAFLKTKPFHVATQVNFLVAAATRRRPFESLQASGCATAFSMSLTVIRPTQRY